MSTALDLIGRLDEIAPGDLVPLAVLTRIAPEVKPEIRFVLKEEGLVRPTGKRAPHGGSWLIPREDALTVLVAVVLAAVASSAIVTMARMIKNAGLDPLVLAAAMK